MEEKHSIWIRMFAILFKKWISIINESRELEIIKLKKLVAHDPLTGALSRTEFIERAEHIFFLLKRNNTSHYFSIVYIDVDDFKYINDNYGHHVGDEILVSLVGFLKKWLRESDFIGRFGGDEFVLFLGESNLEFGKDVITKMKSALSRRKFSTGGENSVKLNVEISCGVSSTSEKIDNLAQLIRNADSNMYEQKKEKHNG